MLVQASLDRVRGHGLTGSTAGEQPKGIPVGGGSEVESAVGVAQEQFGEGTRDRRGWVAESNSDLAVVFDDVVDGEAQDRGQRLGVEQHQHRGGAGEQRDVLLGEESTDRHQPLLLADRRRVASVLVRECTDRSSVSVALTLAVMTASMGYMLAVM